jgi:hypothetical protein
MARFVWRNADLNDLASHIRAVPKEMSDVCGDIAVQCAQEGANEMYRNIDRIDTEHMKGSVGNSDLIQRDANTFGADFGWGVKGSDVEDYFLYQEQGFRHVGTGSNVPPMHALLGAFISAREKFFSRVTRAVRGA